MRIVGGALALVLTACGGAAQHVSTVPSAPKRPAWLQSVPREAGQMYVVGVKSRAGSLEEGKAAAHQNAAAQASNLIVTRLESEFASYSSSDSSRDAAEEKIRARTAASIKNLAAVDEYYEKTSRAVGSYYEESYDVWVLARFPLAEADAERQRLVQEERANALEAIGALEASAQHEAAARPQEAWLEVLRAARLLRGASAGTTLDHARFGRVSEVITAVDVARRKLEVAAFGARLELRPGPGRASQHQSTLQGELATRLQKSGVNLLERGPARFRLTVDFDVPEAKGKALGQRVRYVSYAATATDTWSGKVLRGSSGESKGFAKSDAGAITDAVQQAAEAIAEALAVRLAKAVAEEQQTEPLAEAAAP